MYIHRLASAKVHMECEISFEICEELYVGLSYESVYICRFNEVKACMESRVLLKYVE